MSHLALATEVAVPPAIVTFDGEHVPAASINRAIFLMPGPIGWAKWAETACRGLDCPDQGDGENVLDWLPVRAGRK
jgi:hypothetical protein